MASFEKALAIEPDFGGAHYNRGIVLRDMKRFEEALASFDAALKLRPGNAEILNHRAIALQNLKRFAQALADLDEALTINPTSTEILNNRGRLLFECNRVEEGLGDFRRSAALAYGTGAGMSGSVGLPHKARHDQEQQAYLMPLRPLAQIFRRMERDCRRRRSAPIPRLEISPGNGRRASRR